jgi:hypothetical protein
MEIQPTELDAFQAHPGPATTLTLPEPPDAGTDVGGVDTAKVQGPLNEKAFEGVLIEFPAGPTAVTRASYAMPAAGHEVKTLARAIRMRPLLPTFGLPRFST